MGKERFQKWVDLVCRREQIPYFFDSDSQKNFKEDVRMRAVSRGSIETLEPEFF